VVWVRQDEVFLSLLSTLVRSGTVKEDWTIDGQKGRAWQAGLRHGSFCNTLNLEYKIYFLVFT
jgi:hypothetical protein